MPPRRMARATTRTRPARNAAHQPELNKAGTVEKKAPIDNEFAADFGDDEEDDSARMSRMNQVMQGVARQVSLDPNDGMDL